MRSSKLITDKIRTVTTAAIVDDYFWLYNPAAYTYLGDYLRILLSDTLNHSMLKKFMVALMSLSDDTEENVLSEFRSTE